MATIEELAAATCQHDRDFTDVWKALAGLTGNIESLMGSIEGLARVVKQQGGTMERLLDVIVRDHYHPIGRKQDTELEAKEES